MNRAIDSRKIHTAPVTLASIGRETEAAKSQKKAALVRELDGYHARLQEARSPIFAKRRKARDKCDAASKAGKVDIAAAVESAIVDTFTEGDLGDIFHWRYTVKKLKACAEAGVLEAERDAELAGLRQFMRSLK
jgi:hypothetical protein